MSFVLIYTVSTFPQIRILAGFFFPTRILPAELGLDEGTDARQQVYTAFGLEQTKADTPQE